MWKVRALFGLLHVTKVDHLNCEFLEVNYIEVLRYCPEKRVTRMCAP